MRKITQRIHIIPIGKDTKDRIIKPLILIKPDKVYLFTVDFNKDAFEGTYNEVKKILIRDFGIPADKVVEKKTNYYKFIEFLKEIAWICGEEQNEGNEIYINVSGGTMLSIVGAYAKSLFGAIPYFSQLDHNTGKIQEKPFIPDIPNLNFSNPPLYQIKLLLAMYLYTISNPDEILTKSKCIEILGRIEDKPLISDTQPKDYNKLNRQYLHKFEKQGYIESNPVPKSGIKILKDGVFAARVFGAYYGLNESYYKKLLLKS